LEIFVVDREGAIAAATASGEGGNMNLQVQNFLLLRRGGQITASASGTGNGGNINIDTPALVAISQENSDISANSVNARGENVIINTQSLFGIQFRLTETPLSDITATGANSQSNGIVQINNPDLDPNSGLVELPYIPIDYSQLIAQGCLASQGNSFTYIGRGGLPPKPSGPLRVITPETTDWVTLDTKKYEVNQQSQSFVTTPTKRIDIQPTEIVEATGWEISDRGEILLTDASNNVSADGSFVPISCLNR
jgi:large exoprotein involved in heme utilization and adhesion